MKFSFEFVIVQSKFACARPNLMLPRETSNSRVCAIDRELEHEQFKSKLNYKECRIREMCDPCNIDR